jgi:hypothetical protein
MTDLDLIDLDAERVARREANAKHPRLRLDGTTYDLPVEFPLDVLSPILDVKIDLALVAHLLNQAMSANTEDQRNAVSIILDILVTNPDLPIEAIDAGKTVARNLLGDDAYAALVRIRPSREDLSVLVRGVMRAYGVSLGEASRSADSSESDGATSSETSTDTTDSTPATSGETEPTPT